MDNKASNNTFAYTYSAKEQAEIKRIREKYAPPEKDSIDKLRALDAGVTSKANTASIAIGTIGALIMGIGMCMVLVWGGFLIIPGIVIGSAGIALVSLAYPVYNAVLKREREKIAPEILRISEELMK